MPCLLHASLFHLKHRGVKLGAFKLLPAGVREDGQRCHACLMQDSTGPLQPVMMHSDSIGYLPGNEQNVNPKDLHVQLGAPSSGSLTSLLFGASTLATLLPSHRLQQWMHGSKLFDAIVLMHKRCLAGSSPRSPTRGRGCGVGFSSPLTRMVATPCYRAPEVWHLDLLHCTL